MVKVQWEDFLSYNQQCVKITQNHFGLILIIVSLIKERISNHIHEGRKHSTNYNLLLSEPARKEVSESACVTEMTMVRLLWSAC